MISLSTEEVSPAYEPVIGLEIHAQLLTRTKMFCACPAEFGAEPNTNVCPVCLGLPGALPATNATAVEYAIKVGLATECEIVRQSVFARKNYFYPDCPKNYQITQYEIPVCVSGSVTLGDNGKPIRIRRIHLEEDAGKLTHAVGEDVSYVDMNRSGVPLLEIVTEPDISNPKEASQFLQRLRSILRYLEVCNGNMEEGSLRCDVNVSVREAGSTEIGVKTEIKNVNSFKAVEQALEFEIERQKGTVRRGEDVGRATLLWDADSATCRVMRSKEETHDYRYFPEPDLRVLEVPDDLIERIAKGLPELPHARENRFVRQYGIPRYDATVLTGTRALADYFEDTVAAVLSVLPGATGAARSGADATDGEEGEATGRTKASKSVSNWIMGEVLHELKERRIELSEFLISPSQLAALIGDVTSGRINIPTAKDVFREMAETGDDPADIIAAGQLAQITDEPALRGVIERVLEVHPGEVAAYTGGKKELLRFFVGQVMKATDGRAHPMKTTNLLEEILEGRRENGSG